MGGGGTGGGGGGTSGGNSKWPSWGMGAWAAEAGEKGMEEYTEYLDLWQHLVSCGRDGRVILHSLARATRPRDTITPSVVALSPRGELAASHEEIDRSREFVGIVLDERTERAPGTWTVDRGVRRKGRTGSGLRVNPCQYFRDVVNSLTQHPDRG